MSHQAYKNGGITTHVEGEASVSCSICQSYGAFSLLEIKLLKSHTYSLISKEELLYHLHFFPITAYNEKQSLCVQYPFEAGL